MFISKHIFKLRSVILTILLEPGLFANHKYDRPFQRVPCIFLLFRICLFFTFPRMPLSFLSGKYIFQITVQVLSTNHTIVLSGTTDIPVPWENHSHTTLLHETPQDPQVGLAQVFMQLLLLPWVLVHVRPSVCPPRVESLLPPVL